jgi:hypothetical protein
VPYPAYQGKLFYFDIPVGHAWDHEFPVINRNTGEAMEFEAGWTGICKIRDAKGITLATLTETGPGAGVNGTLAFTTGKVALNLPATFTAALTPTTSYRPGPSKSFVYADVSLTDPTDGQPYILARGKGVIYLPTTVGA